MSQDDALPGRPDPLPHVPETHAVNGNRIQPPFPEGMQTAVFGAGCFWGVEKVFWQVPGVWSTAAGYAGGYTPDPTHEEVCSARTGHTEVVLVVFDPAVVSYGQLLKVFWEDHDPTQGMHRGNDVGTQYRSAIYVGSPEQEAAARASRDQYQERLEVAGYGEITTEIAPLGQFFYAEGHHHKTCTRCPTATARCTRPESAARSASPASDPRGIGSSTHVLGAGTCVQLPLPQEVRVGRRPHAGGAVRRTAGLPVPAHVRHLRRR